MTKIIKHEKACYISYVEHQLSKDAAVYISAIIFEDSLLLELLANVDIKHYLISTVSIW